MSPNVCLPWTAGFLARSGRRRRQVNAVHVGRAFERLERYDVIDVDVGRLQASLKHALSQREVGGDGDLRQRLHRQQNVVRQ